MEAEEGEGMAGQEPGPGLQTPLGGIVKLPPVGDAGQYVRDFTLDLLRRDGPEADVEGTYAAKVNRKAVMLDNPPAGAAANRAKTGGRKKKGPMTAKTRRALGLYDIPKDQQKHEQYLPFHHLWTQYMAEVLKGVKPSSNSSEVQQKFLKADYHGAKIKVVRSTCPSLIGLHGIVVQETAQTFRVVTQQDELKVIPKAHNVFAMVAEGFLCTIHGSRICYKPSERAVRKFKVKADMALRG